MFAFQSPPTPSSYSTPRRSSAATTPKPAPKLRDSCDACAVSKVKCHKEKPSCSRCVKRKITCEYVATKRGGRRHDRWPSRSDSGGNASPVEGSTKTDVPQLLPLNTADPMMWFPGVDDVPAGLSNSQREATASAAASLGEPSATLHTILTSGEESLSSLLPGLTGELDDFFPSPLTSAMPDASDTDVLSQTNFFSSNRDGEIGGGPANLLEEFMLFGDPDGSDLAGFSDHPCAPVSRDSVSTDDHSIPDHRGGAKANELQCGCLINALALLKQLFPNPATVCLASAHSQHLESSDASPTIQAVIAKNKETVESVDNMLRCTCAQDTYLLMVTVLIVFKMLGWYAAATRARAKTHSCSDREDAESTCILYHTDNDAQHTSRQSSLSSSILSLHHSEQVRQISTVIGGYHLEGKDSGRMVAQLVLSELHGVQRLVNQLSAKLKAVHLQASKMYGVGAVEPSSLPEGGYEWASPFSAVVLEQMAMDLRKRLKTLSLEIVERLRSE